MDMIILSVIEKSQKHAKYLIGGKKFTLRYKHDVMAGTLAAILDQEGNLRLDVLRVAEQTEES